MKVDLVFNHAYDGYTHSLNGRSKEAIKSFTKMYKEGVKNPSKAKYSIESATKKANFDYDNTTKNSETKTMFNTIKTFGRRIAAYMFNPEYRNSENNFFNAYKKLYPKTHFIRDVIISERNIP